MPGFFNRVRTNFQKPETRRDLAFTLPFLVQLLTTDDSRSFNSALQNITETRLERQRAKDEEKRLEEQQKFAREEREDSQTFTSTENQKGREFTSAENQADRTSNTREKVADRQHDIRVQELAQDFQRDLELDRQKFQERMNDKDFKQATTLAGINANSQKELINLQLQNQTFQQLQNQGIRVDLAQRIAERTKSGDFSNLDPEEQAAISFVQNQKKAQTNIERLQGAVSILGGINNIEVPETSIDPITNRPVPLINRMTGQPVTRPMTPNEALSIFQDPKQILGQMVQGLTTNPNPVDIPVDNPSNPRSRNLGDELFDSASNTGKDAPQGNALIGEAINQTKSPSDAVELGAALVDDLGFDAAIGAIQNSNLDPVLKERAIEAARKRNTSSTVQQTIGQVQGSRNTLPDVRGILRGNRGN